MCPSLCRDAVTGEILASQDVTQRRLYLVMEGQLEVAKDGTQIATVGVGEFTGEVILLEALIGWFGWVGRLTSRALL